MIKKNSSLIVNLLVKLPEKFLSLIWNLVTNAYPKFVTFRKFFKHEKKILIDMDSENSIHSFGKKIGNLIIYCIIDFVKIFLYGKLLKF